MTIKATEITVPIYSVTEDKFGEIEAATQIGEEIVTSVTLCADEGKCIVRKGENIPLGVKISLGSGEKAEDFAEISVE